eukprot:CAMPEP_0198649882 /NCGR_PEP_ID=MMETSP1467-20131203/4597_1 /TAXON_ID=1462469 /ORGANISM="unid. sp., Strain CCMP2135" /LENGTH=310 /DNA_ID=CAMNT_0044385701 /DNA_START=95 /DNA_END=1027 /DNA_ORIENTATION=-
MPVRELEWTTKEAANVVVRGCGHVFRLGADTAATLRQMPPVVLIVTTAVAEMDAVLERLERLVGYPDAIDGIPVTIGKFGGRVVLVCKTRQGSIQTYDVVQTLLLSDFLKGRVKLMLPVGFAWGARPASDGGDQRIGDVLVAERLVDAGLVKVKDGKEILRGSVFADEGLANSVNDMLTKKWPSESQTHFGKERIPEDPRRPIVHVGTVISFPKLIDDRATAKRWITHEQIKAYKPIGGEMELYQIAYAAVKNRIGWLLVKAICDFAGLDGIDKEDHRKDQALAAAAAAHFADWLLRQEAMGWHLLPRAP